MTMMDFQGRIPEGTMIKRYRREKGCWTTGSVVAPLANKPSGYQVRYKDGTVEDFRPDGCQLRELALLAQVRIGSRILLYSYEADDHIPATIRNIDDTKADNLLAELVHPPARNTVAVDSEDNCTEWVDLRRFKFCLIKEEKSDLEVDNCICVGASTYVEKANPLNSAGAGQDESDVDSVVKGSTLWITGESNKEDCLANVVGLNTEEHLVQLKYAGKMKREWTDLRQLKFKVLPADKEGEGPSESPGTDLQAGRENDRMGAASKRSLGVITADVEASSDTCLSEANAFMVASDVELNEMHKQMVTSVGKGDRLAVWWPVEGHYFEGVVTRKQKNKVHINYDDGDTGWIDLQFSVFFQIVPDEKSSSSTHPGAKKRARKAL